MTKHNLKESLPITRGNYEGVFERERGSERMNQTHRVD